MKKYPLFLSALVFILIVLLCPVGGVNASPVEWLSVQYRDYAGPNDVNRLMFGGELTPATVDISSFRLLVKGVPTNLTIDGGSPLDFRVWSNRNRAGRYIGDGQWEFDPFLMTRVYYANVDALPIGTYEMIVNDSDANRYYMRTYYGGQVLLPRVEAGSFNMNFDSSGNFSFDWGIPGTLPDDTFFMVAIEGYNRLDDLLGEMYISTPDYLSNLFLPQNIIADFGDVDYMRIGVQIRTYDGDNRAYSEWRRVDVTAIPLPASILLLGSGIIALVSVRRSKRRM